jgi:hypothetical protein
MDRQVARTLASPCLIYATHDKPQVSRLFWPFTGQSGYDMPRSSTFPLSLNSVKKSHGVRHQPIIR